MRMVHILYFGNGETGNYGTVKVDTCEFVT